MKLDFNAKHYLTGNTQTKVLAASRENKNSKTGKEAFLPAVLTKPGQFKTKNFLSVSVCVRLWLIRIFK
jgi:hypothetical protein